jgi:hypothetical protein
MLNPIRSVAVFCGARLGADPVHAEAARELGAAIAEAGMTLIYGGGGVGLMGEVARSAVEAGGRVRGVIPEFLTRIERPYDALTELEVTGSMHTRKTRMYELADAFVTLSGGLGTLDETVEVLTWRQLGLHDKPIVVLDVAGWARPFLALLDSVIAQGFAAEGHRRLISVAADVDEAMALLGRAPVPDTAAPAERL